MGAPAAGDSGRGCEAGCIRSGSGSRGEYRLMSRIVARPNETMGTGGTLGTIFFALFGINGVRAGGARLSSGGAGSCGILSRGSYVLNGLEIYDARRRRARQGIGRASGRGRV